MLIAWYSIVWVKLIFVPFYLWMNICCFKFCSIYLKAQLIVFVICCTLARMSIGEISCTEIAASKLYALRMLIKYCQNPPKRLHQFMVTRPLTPLPALDKVRVLIQCHSETSLFWFALLNREGLHTILRVYCHYWDLSVHLLCPFFSWALFSLLRTWLFVR